MSVESQDLGILQRALDSASQNLTIGMAVRLGLDPSNITYDAILDRLIDIALSQHHAGEPARADRRDISDLDVRGSHHAAPLRVLCIISSVFLLGAALSGSGPALLSLSAGAADQHDRLVHILVISSRKRGARLGAICLFAGLGPCRYMVPRDYRKGDAPFAGDAATEMFLTVSGKFLVTEYRHRVSARTRDGGVYFGEKPPDPVGRMHRSGEVLTIAYEKPAEVYFQKPGVRVLLPSPGTSDRLMQNFARSEALIERATGWRKAGTTARPTPI